ncbi:conjugal transfer protein TrbC [Legionella nautarum]|uniref:Conjugal transfer protein TrbC n=1 Tax=Legionella nautarum TaxID=45070 RepID=A0A0W0X208_9GAMM|nr:TrbC/VirB2 family protein [Legionella nautarum]KTD38603.1 conjugal transfer protein TrbC [Legionella nautarum]
MNLTDTSFNPKFLFFITVLLGLLLVTHPSMAATAGGGLPYEGWLTKVQNSITGPVAYTISIIGLVAAGSMLIFGGDLNGFARILVFFVLVLSFIIAAQNTISAITGKSAEIKQVSHFSDGESSL